jgi:protein involved in sex pheromone biosynthesis
MSEFLNIPTSSQWVTFPVTSRDKITINWEDNFHSYVNTYYVAKRYYGILEPSNESVANTKLEVTTPIYIKGKAKLTVLGQYIDNEITLGMLQAVCSSLKIMYR